MKNIGEVIISIGERSYSLCFNHNALADLEGALGVTLGPGVNPFAMGYRGFRALLWAGLKKQLPRITVEAAGELIDVAGGSDVLMEPVVHAFALASMSEEEFQKRRAEQFAEKEPKNA